MSDATLVFDGDCVFCQACVRFMHRRMRNTPIIVAWQESDLGALGLTAAQCSEAVQWVSADRQKKLSGHFAIAQLVRDSGEWWRFLGTVMKFPIASPIAAYIYKKIANSRRCAVRSTP